MNWQSIWQNIVNFFTSNGWKILEFFIILILGIVLIKILINITRRIFAKTKVEKIAQQFLLAIIKFILYLILVLILLSFVGIQISGIITALSALLLAVGIALESNIANLANGIVIVATHMFKKGDFIIVDGKEGSIVDINFLFTTLMTTDNKKVTLPNSTIVNSSVVNAGANATRRIDFTFSVAYESDVEKVKEIIISVMKSNGNVYDNEEHTPFCRLKTLGSSSIDFFANCWVDKEDYWDTYYYIMENVYNEFKRNGISIPYNQLEVRSRTDTVVLGYNKRKLPQREEKQRNNAEHFDLETADFVKMIKSRQPKKNSSAKNAKTKDAIAAENSGETAVETKNKKAKKSSTKNK